MFQPTNQGNFCKVKLSFSCERMNKNGYDPHGTHLLPIRKKNIWSTLVKLTITE